MVANYIKDIPEVRDLGPLFDWVYHRPKGMLTLSTQVESDKVDALVDSASEFNLLSLTKAREWDAKVEPLTGLPAQAANGSKMKIHGTTVLSAEITDSRGRKQRHEVPCVVADLTGYDLLLGLPWFDEHDPKVNVATRRVLFRKANTDSAPPYQKIAAEDAEQFDRTMRDPFATVYACTVSAIGELSLSGTIGDNKSVMPSCYSDFADIASDKDYKELPKRSEHDLRIELEEGKQPPHYPMYNLSVSELETLRKYIDEYLSRGWIRRSRSPAGAPMLFAKKKDGTLRLCVDYRGLNKITIKNRGSLPLITESLDRLKQAKIFTKLDLKEAYHRVRIAEGDEWKTAFRTRYGHFEYTVMPFGLTNAPAQFQGLIAHTLAGLVDITCVVYLDDILIFSDNEEDHREHVREILKRLREAKLFINAKKCEWHTRTTEYLGFVVSPEGLTINPERLETIRDWPKPTCVRDIRIFIGFMNYYRRFIANFSRIALPLTVLTKKAPNSARQGPAMRREESVGMDIGPEAETAFQTLKDAFLKVPILVHFEPGRRTRLETDASGGAIGAICSQFVPDADKKGQWRPIDFFSKKLNSAQYNYDTHDKELLAIVESVKHWRQYLQGQHFEVLTDHHNLQWFMETKTLTSRHVRSYLTLSEYDFVMTYRTGSTNPADGLSRRPDYMLAAQEPKQKNHEAFVKPLAEILSRQQGSGAHVSAVTTRSHRDEESSTLLRAEIVNFKESDKGFVDNNASLEDRETIEPEDPDSWNEPANDLAQSGTESPAPAGGDPKWVGTLEEREKAIADCHDGPLSGHFGASRTLERVRRKNVWTGLNKDVANYVHDCERCQRATHKRHKPFGLLRQLPIPDRPWQHVTMDFITDLPPSRLLGLTYDSILVIVDRFSKMAHYVPARMDWDGTDLAQAWIREVIRLHGNPETILSDRGPIMKAKHWDTFHHYLNSRRVLTSSFHPQTDGQTERQNQTLEQYLRIFCSLEQDDWALWISLAEYAYNDSKHSATGYTPYQVCFGYNPSDPTWPGQPLGEGESPEGFQIASKLLEIRRNARKKLEVVQEYQKTLANKKRLPLELKVGDKVWVSNRNLKSDRPSKKLDWKYLGPGTVKECVGNPPTAYRIDLPELKGAHPVFHPSLLEPYTVRGHPPRQQAPIQDTLRQHGDDVYDVDYIVDRRQNREGHWEYLIKWTGYDPEDNSWEPAASISGNSLKIFWNKLKASPRRSTIELPAAQQPQGKEPAKRGRGRPPKKKGNGVD
jgi:hypothetical protein